jgi:hydrogenase maturation protein HypF
MRALAAEPLALEVRIRGIVQGVGFRPALWRMARELSLSGEVFNDSEGVLLRVGGDRERLAALLDQMKIRLPPLARVDAIETRTYSGPLSTEFRIAESTTGKSLTQVSPDAVICSACIAELQDRNDRHFRYPFTSCTHCGPRLSIVTAIPYDRARTTMAPFPLCDDCQAEYGDTDDRRFHAEAIACPNCGPTASLITLGNSASQSEAGEDLGDCIARAANLIRGGAIVAIKGIGGYHLACDAKNAEAVGRLRRLKRRERKPFALMARDVGVIRRYCAIGEEEERWLGGAQGPIVLLGANGSEPLPPAVAPGLDTLGFMLPTTPLHLLLLQDMDGPLIMTSGNISDEPPIIDDVEASKRLAGIAAFALVHDRAIANRVDDSLVRIMDGRCRVLRRARGFAPSALRLPAGFEAAPDLVAMGGELKATFSLLKGGQAILSQHQGDLESAATFDDYRKNLALYREIFMHQPAGVVVDRHPEYLSTKLGCAEAAARRVPLIDVQHHHAHVAGCLAENGRTLDAPAVLGIVLDGLGFGDDGTIWGGEFLLADYRNYRRLARLTPVAMPGGAQAVREPWRNLYAHLVRAIGWDALTTQYAGLDFYKYLHAKPRALLEGMMASGVNSPLASSCGRLFDAVAAALDVCRERQAYEGEAAMRLEALAAGGSSTDHTGPVYPFAISWEPNRFGEIDSAPMWRALLDDLRRGVAASTIALRFHTGLSNALAATTKRLAARVTDGSHFDTVALSGGCFQNRLLLESAAEQLRAAGFVVLTHAEVPANDGGLALGQAVVGAARLLDSERKQRTQPCASAFPAALSE